MSYGDMARKIKEMCARDIGTSLKEAAEAINRPLNIASVYIATILNRKEVVKSGVRGAYRYFKDSEKAAQHDEIAQAARLIKMQETAIRRREYQASNERAKRERIRLAEGREKRVPKEKKATPPIKQTKQYIAKPKVEPKVIWPEDVKITCCESGRDTRFTFEPEPGWTGQITRDWMDDRLGMYK